MTLQSCTLEFRRMRKVARQCRVDVAVIGSRDEAWRIENSFFLRNRPGLFAALVPRRTD